MSLRTTLSVRQRQKLALTPGLQTGLSILRLPMLDLIDAIEAEAADNPYLLHDDLRIIRPEAGSSFDPALDKMAAQPSLVTGLHQQIGAMSLPPDLRMIAEYLAGDLREDGYLETPLAEIAAELGLALALVEAGLAALQTCDPVGVGARDLAECLCLQLVDGGLALGLAQLVVAHLHLFAEANWRELARETGLSETELRRLAELIRGLTPHPVQEAVAPGPMLFPDLVLVKDAAGGFGVTLPFSLTDQVRLNVALLQARKDQGQTFARDRLDRATTLLAALRFRGETLLRIGQLIATRQHRFFDLGPDHLVPMSRTALARDLGLHPSTVGRAVSAKALEVQGRLYPLSLFFSSALPHDGTRNIAAFVVQRHIARMISDEPANNPISDAEICAALNATGVDIARRTVAKYRGCMRIPASFARRRRKAAQRLRPETPGGGGFQVV